MKYGIIIILSTVIYLTGCNQQNSDNKDEINEATTKAVLDHHWETFVNNDLEGVMEDYTEESILITPDVTYRGLDEIRQNFINAFSAFPRSHSTLKLNQSKVEKDLAYILWQADTPDFNLNYATDTFLIRNGKIIRQTYAGVAVPK